MGTKGSTATQGDENHGSRSFCLIFRNRKKSLVAKSGEYGQIIAMPR